MSLKPSGPILITGANGQLGQELCRHAGSRPIVGLNREQLDICDAQALAHVMTEHRPSIIINAAAYTAVDKAESEPDKAFAINRDGPAQLAQIAAAQQIPLIHISTDYVFDGNKAEPYDRNDSVNPLGIYGLSKWQGEQAVREQLSQHLILRVSWVFGAYGQNFVSTMLRLAQQRPELKVVSDQRGAPTHAGALAKAALQLADRHLAGEALAWGTWHYSGKGESNWHAFANEILDRALALGMIKQKPLIHAINTEDYPTAAPRPRNSTLNLEPTQHELGLAPTDWRLGLEETLNSWLAAHPSQT